MLWIGSSRVYLVHSCSSDHEKSTNNKHEKHDIMSTLLKSVRQSNTWGLYARAAQRAARLTSLLPLLFLYISQVYLVMCVGYLLVHPELVVDMLFGILDAVPNYGAYAGSRVWDRFSSELHQRIR